MPIALDDFAKLVVVALACDRGACGHHVAAVEQELPEGAGVVPLGLQGFNVRLASGRKHLPVGSAAVAVLVREPGRAKNVRPLPPSQNTRGRTTARPYPGEIGPRIIIDVVRFLPVSATEQRGTPAARQRAGKKGDGIRRTARRAIQQELLLRLAARTPRQEIDDAAHRAGAVQRRRHAFDDLDLPEIHRRDLQQPEPANLTKQRQARRRARACTGPACPECGRSRPQATARSPAPASRPFRSAS